MDMVTVTAKTVEEAVTKALIELQTTSDKPVSYTHLDVYKRQQYREHGIAAAKGNASHFKKGYKDRN